MPSVVFYNSIAQRDTLKQQANAIGESTIHDDFLDSNGNPTDGNSGRLTFDVKPNPIPKPIRNLTQRQFLDELASERNVNII